MAEDSYGIKEAPEQVFTGGSEHVENDVKFDIKIDQRHAEIYAEALRQYPDEASIDKEAEKKLKRKLDRRILPLLGICYFFYVWISTYTKKPAKLTMISSMSTRPLSPMLPFLASSQTFT